MLELSHEDMLRLNVLVTNVEAVRIDERTMTVYGLSARGEARVQLNPSGRPAVYLKAVREFLSSAALGSASGYPVHLNRWTRMGQARDTNLARLLMLGEPEAITAVVCAPGLTDELARRAWWADPVSETARRMLARECVVDGSMGKVLAEFLVEHLPFETEARVMIDTVRLVLQPGLVSAETRRRLWDKGATQGAYRIGFLQAEPDSLPEPLPARADAAALDAELAALGGQGNALAAVLRRTLGAGGQSFLATCERVLQRPTEQDAVVALLNTLSGYFRPMRHSGDASQDVVALVADARTAATGEPWAQALLAALPKLEREVVAAYALARMDEAIVTPIFARSSASGSLMRRKIEPMIRAVLDQMAVLRGTAGG